jgi:hypothetical protein
MGLIQTVDQLKFSYIAIVEGKATFFYEVLFEALAVLVVVSHFMKY